MINITCCRCGMMSAFATGMVVPHTARTSAEEYQCANCHTVFARMVDTPLQSDDIRAARLQDDPYNCDYMDSWSPYSHPAASKKRSIIIVSKGKNFVARNRSRKTARLTDIKGKDEKTSESLDFTINEVNLEL